MQSKKQPLGINPHFLEGSYKQMFSPAPGHMLLLFPNNICVRRWQDKERTKALHPGCWLSLQLFKVPLANRSTDSTRNSFVDLCRFIGGGTARFSYQLLLKQDILGFTTLCILAESSPKIQFYRTKLHSKDILTFCACSLSLSQTLLVTLLCLCLFSILKGKPDLNTSLPVRQTASIFKTLI